MAHFIGRQLTNVCAPLSPTPRSHLKSKDNCAPPHHPTKQDPNVEWIDASGWGQLFTEGGAPAAGTPVKTKQERPIQSEKQASSDSEESLCRIKCEALRKKLQNILRSYTKRWLNSEHAQAIVPEIVGDEKSGGTYPSELTLSILPMKNNIIKFVHGRQNPMMWPVTIFLRIQP